MSTRTFAPAAADVLARLIQAAARQSNPVQLARMERLISAAVALAN